MTDTFRAALERLLARLDETTDPDGPVPAWSDSYLAARAALAQPEPPAEGDVAELCATAYQFVGAANGPVELLDNLFAAANGEPLPHGPGAGIPWTPDVAQPVAVSERLPGPEDWDAEGMCWWFNPGQPAMSNPHIATSSWRLCRMLSGKPMGSHWLPAHALPTPPEAA
jgi:hypothetical protein